MLPSLDLRQPSSDHAKPHTIATPADSEYLGNGGPTRRLLAGKNTRDTRACTHDAWAWPCFQCRGYSKKGLRNVTQKRKKKNIFFFCSFSFLESVRYCTRIGPCDPSCIKYPPATGVYLLTRLNTACYLYIPYIHMDVCIMQQCVG